jgi:peroxiredoxin (alkyl hydroperoxide reductase subunit C)
VSAVAARYEEFEALGVQVLSISVDSPFVHKIWDDKELSIIAGHPVPFPMLSDSSGAIGELYGVYDRVEGVNVRGRFLIDPKGNIQAMEVLTPPVGRNVSEALRQIKAYQLVQRTGGKEVTPSGWQEGGKTLKPGIELVGKVWEQWTVADSYK